METQAIEQEGFLAPDMDRIAAKVQAEHPQHMALVARVNRLGRGLLIGRTVSLSRTEDKAAVALLIRTVQTFQGACLLATRGMRADARALARSAFESAVYCLAACRDYKGKDGIPLVKRLFAEHERFRNKAINEILSRAHISEEVRATLGEAKAQIDDDLLRAIPGINVRELMTDLGIGSAYTNFYRPLSQDAHVSALSLDYHIGLRVVSAKTSCSHFRSSSLPQRSY